MITRKMIVPILMGMVAVCVAVAPAARADEYDQATRVTFNQPIEIPGNEVLAAGTYWFVMAPDMGPAGIVRIFSADRTKLYAKMPVQSTLRRNTTQDSEFILAQPSQNQPKQLLSWFYPDRLYGHQFIYGREEEKTITHEAKLTVMASPAASAYGD